MTDTIAVMGIRARGRHGVLDFEREMGQTFVVDVEMAVDIAQAGRSDDLAHTVDYGALCDVVATIVGGGRPQLLEHLAAAIAEAVLAADERITSVTVGVRKLRPPVPHALATSGVRITRP